MRKHENDRTVVSINVLIFVGRTYFVILPTTRRARNRLRCSTAIQLYSTGILRDRGACSRSWHTTCTRIQLEIKIIWIFIRSIWIVQRNRFYNVQP